LNMCKKGDGNNFLQRWLVSCLIPRRDRNFLLYHYLQIGFWSH